MNFSMIKLIKKIHFDLNFIINLSNDIEKCLLLPIEKKFTNKIFHHFRFI